MHTKNIFAFILLLFPCSRAFSQGSCSTPGQNSSTAFPVCGTNTFAQTTVPLCGGRLIHDPCFFKDGIQADTNPFWYKFTCFKAGTLGFLITPGDLNDDYDWELFDITGRNPNDIFDDSSLVVSCNWSGITGITGTAPTGLSVKICAIENLPAISSMPSLKEGHNYLLLVSHYTRFMPSQIGYQLSFEEGTAGITDTLPPGILKVGYTCDASQLFIQLNKKMKCKSLAGDGSDFGISSATSAITGASGNGCGTGFDFDTVLITLTNPLSPGNYSMTIKNGSDLNTLLDYCDRNIPPANNIDFKISPPSATPLDSLTPLFCKTQSLELVFDKRIKCNSVAADGSDFIVSGPSPVTVTAATGNCLNNGLLSNKIMVVLSAPLTTAGNYQIKLAKGSDGNTIIDECGFETTAGSSLNFTTGDTVSADFTYKILNGCKTDTILFSHNGNNGVNQWLWNFDNIGSGSQKNETAYFPPYGPRKIKLVVSNGTCRDSSTKVISLGDSLKADFETNNLICPDDPVQFINKSTGDITNYYWDFGDGSSSNAQTVASFNYPSLNEEKTYLIRLIIENKLGCFDTALNTIKVLKNCPVEVPSAFTPNGDGLNDFLYPINAFTAADFEFSVYNRYGQLVFYTKDATQKWDGTIKGKRQIAGAYIWILKYTSRDANRKVLKSGTSLLLR